MLYYTVIISFRFLSNSKVTTQFGDTKIDALFETFTKLGDVRQDSHIYVQQLPLFDSVSPEKA